MKYLLIIKSILTKKLIKAIIAFCTVLFLIIFVIPFTLHSNIERTYQDKIYQDVETIPGETVAIVFGAGIWDEDTPSDILKDRILTSVNLYKVGKVKKIVMSGDNSREDYDEPGAMIKYAIRQGVPAEALQPDYAGRRTYDTCIRARDIFDVKEAILITQNFHLPRALYICNSLGVESIGLSADLNVYQGMNYMQFRDVYALSLSVIDINLRKPEVILGEKIELF